MTILAKSFYKRERLFLIAVFAFILTGCKRFLDDIENDLKYWESMVVSPEKLQNAVKNAKDGDTVIITGELEAKIKHVPQAKS